LPSALILLGLGIHGDEADGVDAARSGLGAQTTAAESGRASSSAMSHGSSGSAKRWRQAVLEPSSILGGAEPHVLGGGLSSELGTLPANVRLSAVRPVVDEEGRLTVKLTVLGRDVESVDQYLDALEKTGAFHDLLSRKEREDNKEGLIEANVEGRYAPQAAVVPVGAAR
jgi:hypothetical protein